MNSMKLRFLRFPMLALWLVCSSELRAQELKVKSEERTPLQYNSLASIPPKLAALLHQHRLGDRYVPVFDEVNPFYLSGDFDGDGIRDYAVLLRLKGKGKEAPSRIAILRGNGKVNWLDDDLNGKTACPRPAWWVFEKGERVKPRLDLNHRPAPKLLGDGFIVARPESSSALVYWDGKSFSLYWQSD